MKRVFIVITIIILFAMFGGTGYFLYQKSEEPEVIYQTDSVFVTDIVKKTVATGSIVPRREIAMKSQVSGVVDKLYVEAGDHVKHGDLIARIKIIPNVVMLNQAESSLKTAQINYENAQIEMNRQRKLYEDNVISEVEYNQFKLDFELTRQAVDAAQSNLDLVKEGASKRSGTVSNLVHSTVTGMVLDVPVKEGSFVIETNTFNDGTTISTIADMNEMIFEGKIDESEVGKLRENMELILKIGALDEVNFIAYLEYISPKGVEENGAIQFPIKAKVTLRNDQFLRSGYSANADIVLDKRDSILAINEGDLLFENDKYYVEVETGEQKFEKREIKTGLSDGINIEVVEGLSKNDRIKKRI